MFATASATPKVLLRAQASKLVVVVVVAVCSFQVQSHAGQVVEARVSTIEAATAKVTVACLLHLPNVFQLTMLTNESEA